MKSTNFDYTGGFPLEQPVLKRMQAATFELLKAFVRHIGCADAGNYIIYGCNISGGNITPGMMYIDGELCPFAGVAGNVTTKIKKQTYTTNAAFENGTNPPVFIETLAVVDATGTEIGSFIRFNFVQDANYVHTDNNFTAALLTKLNGIEAGAEVNVQADWNVTNSSSDAYIKNKPTIIKVGDRNEIILGEIFTGSAGQDFTVPIIPQPNNNYTVLVSLESTNSSWNAANGTATLSYVVYDKQPNSFKLHFREFASATQYLKVSWILINN